MLWQSRGIWGWGEGGGGEAAKIFGAVVRWSSFKREGEGCVVMALVGGGVQLCNRSMAYRSLQRRCMANTEMPLLTATELAVPAPSAPPTPNTAATTSTPTSTAVSLHRGSFKCHNRWRHDSSPSTRTHHRGLGRLTAAAAADTRSRRCVCHFPAWRVVRACVHS